MPRFQALLFIGLILFSAGCGTRATEEQVAVEAIPEEPLPEDKELLADRQAMGLANNRFALDLYAQLREQPGNLFFSPYSIATALTMTSAGARGPTAAEMAKVLHHPFAGDRLHAAVGSLRREVNSGGQKYQLTTANRLWGQKNYGFLPDFMGLMQTHYRAGLEEVDFINQTDAARQRINAWVEKETRQKIKEILPPDCLSTLTRLVLTNAIYFKGNWAYPFDKSATTDQPFTLTDGNKVQAPLMYRESVFRYLSMPDFQAVELPYLGHDLRMAILLPRRADGLAALEKNLALQDLTGWLKWMRPLEVRVFVPRFQMTAPLQLETVLPALGMKLAFSDADFSGMNGGKKSPQLGAVRHKAFVAVNEEGTEAAAATAVEVKREKGAPSGPPVFRADHPFLFLIRDVRSGSILFLGRLVDPR